MSYTPSTERVRDRYRNDARYTRSNDPDPGASFDRWLRDERAAALREAAEALFYNGTIDAERPGYSALHDRADAVETGGGA